MQNGQPPQIQVPDLGQLGQPDPAAWVAYNILLAAGVEPGGSAIIETGLSLGAGGGPLHEVGVIVVALGSSVYIIGISGKSSQGRAKVVPWHAITGIRAAD